MLRDELRQPHPNHRCRSLGAAPRTGSDHLTVIRPAPIDRPAIRHRQNPPARIAQQRRRPNRRVHNVAYILAALAMTTTLAAPVFAEGMAGDMKCEAFNMLDQDGMMAAMKAAKMAPEEGMMASDDAMAPEGGMMSSGDAMGGKRG